ncbi:uncharacterized protein LOC130823524 [Amaranthus tricolor]|uniref:uncharacterized protein LOC130823524 n=1 Tax=Amaranthus tricolor TaxID=29722 RepID=UPI002582D6E6|nr:uncharacterized protein LOC130823524 [Amaranthus tricolor]
MNLLKPSNYTYNYDHQSKFYSNNLSINKLKVNYWQRSTKKAKISSVIRGCSTNKEAKEDEDIMERKTFLSLQEAGLVELSGLSTHERFLCRLTISSLNLLRVIAEQEDCSIEELNAGRVCDWFLKDKLKREQNIGSAVLQWDDDDPFEAHF